MKPQKKIRKLCGLITAAGLSSRMGEFKPLLPLGGQPLLLCTINSLRYSGVEPIVVVLGKRAEDIIPVIEAEDVKVVINSRFATTSMLDSVKLGLGAVSDADGVVFLPADVPLVAPATIKRLIEAFDAAEDKIVFPVYEGQRWHPPIIPARLMREILAYQGAGGLRGALEQFAEQTVEVAVTDRGCAMDADEWQDYEQLIAYQQQREEIEG